MKKCPYCAEEIQDDAIVCKHCGRDLPSGATQVQVTPAVTPPKKGYGCVGVFLVVVILCVVGLAIVGSLINRTTSPVAKPSNSAASAPLAPLTPPPPATKWKRAEDRSALDDSKTLEYSVEAEAPITAWLSRPTPELIVRCQRRKIEVFVDTGTAATVEYGSLDEHEVEIRIDSSRSIHQRWSQSTDNKALFSPSPTALFKSLGTAKWFRFGFTPFNANPQVAEFDVHGFAQPYEELVATCSGKRGRS